MTTIKNRPDRDAQLPARTATLPDTAQFGDPASLIYY